MTKPMTGTITIEDDQVVWRMPPWAADDLALTLEDGVTADNLARRQDATALQEVAEEIRYAIRQRSHGDEA